MTEHEWLTATDPDLMFEFLVNRHIGPVDVEAARAAPDLIWEAIESWHKANQRKERLFACACCRRAWHELGDERSRRAVIVAERYADGLATEQELDTASDDAYTVWDEDEERIHPGREVLSHPLPFGAAAFNVAIPIYMWGAAPAFVAPHTIIRQASPDPGVEAAAQAALLRDIFGNPFRPIVADPDWLTPTVVTLAKDIDTTASFDRVPILADALRDAGSAREEILEHFRQDRPHVRGCWVIDLILGSKSDRS